MILLSGGFDPLHAGHLAMICDAEKLGSVCIALNSDAWLLRKKGFVFQNWDDRFHILRSIRGVETVMAVDDSDGTVCAAIREARPDYFGNGGDRTLRNTPEIELCKQLGVEAVFGLGGSKANSSQFVTARARVQREWGYYDLIAEGPGYKIKRLVVHGYSASQEQRHHFRDEIWVYPDGTNRTIMRGEWHSLQNATNQPIEILEVQIGDCREDDIERRHSFNLGVVGEE